MGNVRSSAVPYQCCGSNNSPIKHDCTPVGNDNVKEPLMIPGDFNVSGSLNACSCVIPVKQLQEAVPVINNQPKCCL